MCPRVGRMGPISEDGPGQHNPDRSEGPWGRAGDPRHQELSQPFAVNRKVFKAYLLKESLDRLGKYRYKSAMLNHLQRWIGQPRWQRLSRSKKLALMLLDHLDGILNYCRARRNAADH